MKKILFVLLAINFKTTVKASEGSSKHGDRRVLKLILQE